MNKITEFVKGIFNINSNTEHLNLVNRPTFRNQRIAKPAPKQAPKPKAKPVLKPAPKPVSKPAPAPGIITQISNTLFGAPLTDVDKAFLDRHNYYRDRIGANRVEWDDGLKQEAQTWLNYLSTTGKCNMYHPSWEVPNSVKSTYQKGTGQNLSVISIPANDPNNSNRVVDNWFKECQLYKEDGPTQQDPTTGPMFSSVGHYTQIANKDVKKIGCASIVCNKIEKKQTVNGLVDRLSPGQHTISACHYDKPQMRPPSVTFDSLIPSKPGSCPR